MNAGNRRFQENTRSAPAEGARGVANAVGDMDYMDYMDYMDEMDEMDEMDWWISGIGSARLSNDIAGSCCSGSIVRCAPMAAHSAWP